MSRHRTVEAIVLKLYPIGESHAGVVLLSEADGILRVIAHGARTAKGRMRGLVQPFVSGVMSLYHDPVKDSYKATDFIVHRYHHGLREDLRRYYQASLWAEVILKSFGGGEGAVEIFRLFRDCLDALDRCIESGSALLGVQFLRRYLELTGLQPDPEYCGRCSHRIENQGAWYSRESGQYFCESCRGSKDLRIDAGAAAYLAYTSSLAPGDSLSVSLAAKSLEGLQTALFAMAEDAVEIELETLRIGREILISGGP